ncbi:ABC transporter ATP-binding protein [Aeromonas veronii]|uniref:ABC transporter ATP-binding protein n=1 Tax=Aeromonas veronii TaxID=654 RepID=UPI001F27600C|nr:ABC transporter ATP-binding protein [Aeromonas veronii]MCF5870570.1 ABC transporter ATP-binding protein [Aeromonas veronii]
MTLTVNRLHFAYQQTPILRDISFSVPRGKLVGIVGPNGCGKSTLLKLLSGQMKAQRGEILLKGKPLASYPMKGLARELAYLPQRPTLPAGILVEQLVQYGRHPHQGWFNQWGEEDARMVRSACERMQLESIWQQSAASLSGGQAQRAWLAMILAQDSDMVLLDEPTSALDIGHQTEVMEAIHRITAEGKTVLLVIHDLAMAARYCDELIAIGEGTIAAMGPAREVVTKDLIDRLYQTSVDILHAPSDGAPIIVPRRHEHGCALRSAS